MKTFIFSIDVEDWFQVENLRTVVNYEEWDEKELRVEKSTAIILDILDRHEVKATFFILGWIAEQCPDLVRQISSKGHEIASHGYAHKLLHEMDSAEVREDLLKSLEILQPLSSNSIIGYRSPSFSITDKSADIMNELGFKYDASYNKFQFNERYGEVIVESKKGQSYLENGLLEFPVTYNTYFGVHWPLGGGYFRLSPSWFINKQIKDSFRKNDIANIYLHPWEFDRGQSRVSGLKLSLKFRHYYGLKQTASKLTRLIKNIKNSSNIFITTYSDIISNLTEPDMSKG